MALTAEDIKLIDERIAAQVGDLENFRRLEAATDRLSAVEAGRDAAIRRLTEAQARLTESQLLLLDTWARYESK